MEIIKGYKIFGPDWTCEDKQYSCPGNFEENVSLSVRDNGMRFWKKIADCFKYYHFDPNNKVAEVIAYGTIAEDVESYSNVYYTNKINIVREIPWQEVLELVNTGKNCIGRGNTGNYNSGNKNSGNYNSHDWNSGDKNSGNWNSGNRNSGHYNSGDGNSGDFNSGNWNSGNRNSGNFNKGNYNNGSHNSGNFNSGNWNSGNYNNGYFNTIDSKVYLFNKPSEWTHRDWQHSKASRILYKMPSNTVEWIYAEYMTDDEKREHPEYILAGGYLKHVGEETGRQAWWDELSDDDKKAVMNIPNFDKEIFEQITGIKVTK